MFNSEQGHIKKYADSYESGNKGSDNGISCKDPNILSSPNILTGLSHEVRTYMNSIVAFSSAGFFSSITAIGRPFTKMTISGLLFFSFSIIVN